MKMQYELLSEDLNDHDTAASVVGLIKSMVDGSGMHHAGALKFGLREGFSLVRRKKPEPPPSSAWRRAGKKQGTGIWGM